MMICQSCGKEIKFWDKAVEVRYGHMSKTSVQDFYGKVDFFHEHCDKAFRKEK
jgi:hypothetical protein